MSVADIRNYEAVNAGAQPVKKPQLKVVRADQLRSTSAAVRQPRLVCPDHPRTSGAPALYAVPTAPSASSAGAVGAVWRLQQGQCSVDQREEVVRSDLASNLVSGWQQLKEVIVSLHFKAVAGFLGLMASSVIAGVLVVGALGLFPSAGAVRVVSQAIQLCPSLRQCKHRSKPIK